MPQNRPQRCANILVPEPNFMKNEKPFNNLHKLLVHSIFMTNCSCWDTTILVTCWDQKERFSFFLSGLHPTVGDRNSIFLFLSAPPFSHLFVNWGRAIDRAFLWRNSPELSSISFKLTMKTGESLSTGYSSVVELMIGKKVPRLFVCLFNLFISRLVANALSPHLQLKSLKWKVM